MPNCGGSASLNYDIATSIETGFSFRRDDAAPVFARSIGDFLFRFDKDLIIRMQTLRGELYFVHSAVVSYGEHACLVCGPSGRGKSTFTWALMHHGLTYLSDELAPVNLETMSVLPFPRALSLKREPPAPYSIEDRALRTEWSQFIEKNHMPGPVASTGEYHIKAAFFLMQNESSTPPSAMCQPIGKGDACTHLYANSLNQLAHPSAGLGAAYAVVQNIDCYSLTVGNLDSMCAAVISIMKS